MKEFNIIPVILSGGKGSRLWPLSRKGFPKQYQNIIKTNKNSLLQETYNRLAGIKNLDSPIIICNQEHRFIVAEQMREINITPKSILLEPFGRNTAAAITLASLQTLDFDKDSILLILSADHFIKDKKEFKEAIYIGTKYAYEDKIVTFGIPPTSPETGYGYIQAENISEDYSNKAYKIENFIEKPKKDLAEEIIKNNNFLWNSGIFMFKPNILINEIKKYSPKVYSCCKETFKKKIKDLDFIRLNSDQFDDCPNISIDIAVMEKTKLGYVVPLKSFWSDIGSWNSVWEVKDKDENQNVLEGNVVAKNSKNCYFFSENRLLVGLGIENLLIIETSDSILVANKDNSQEVKEVVTFLNDNNFPEANKHKKIFRPWGNYTTIEEDSRWQIKKIIVNPESSLSLQMHHHRSEHWVVVSGTAKVEVGNKLEILTENESVYIPLGEKHRLSNPGKIPLILIEVQSGSYVGEDDIVRFEDFYGRVNL